MLAFRSPNFPQGASFSAAPHARTLLKNSRGFSLMELMIVIAVIGILAAVSIPMMLSVIQASQTRGAAQELVTIVNQARQLAVTQNTSYRVDVDTLGNRLRFCSGTAACTDATAWKGAGTDSNGYLKLANEAKLVCGSSLVFNYLGSATTAGTLRVQNSQGTSGLYVIVSASGRVRSDSMGACP